MESLKDIAKRVKPIKKYLRSYLERYEHLFMPMRGMPLTILEIGIGGYKDPNKGGGSLKMLGEYFPNAVVIGLDFHAKNLTLPNNVITRCGS